MTHNRQITASEVCDTLGRKNIAMKLGVGITAVSNASVQGQFPARWYVAIKTLCEKAGVACPDSLFSFIPTTSPAAQKTAGASQ